MAEPGTEAFEKLVALLSYLMFVVTTWSVYPRRTTRSGWRPAPATCRCVCSTATGGPTLLDGPADADAIVEICVTLAPKLAGSRRVAARQPSRLSVPVAMRLKHAVGRDDYLFLKDRR